MKIPIYLFWAALVLSASSCAPSLYFPDKAVTACFDGPQQGFVNVSTKPQIQNSDSGNRMGSPLSFAASAGYSVSEHIGLYGSFSRLTNRAVSEEFSSSWGINSITGGIFNGNRYEGGAIYFTPIGDEDLFECAAGYSFGNISRTSNLSPQRNFTINYYNFFIQPTYGVKTDAFCFSGGAKFWYQRFSDFNASQSVKEDFYSGRTPITERPYVFVNPFMNFEAGIPFVKFNAQIGFPVHFRLSTNDPVLIGFPLYLTFGATFRLEKGVFSSVREIAHPQKGTVQQGNRRSE